MVVRIKFHPEDKHQALTMGADFDDQYNQRMQALLPNAGPGLSLTTPVIADKKNHTSISLRLHYKSALPYLKSLRGKCHGRRNIDIREGHLTLYYRCS